MNAIKNTTRFVRFTTMTLIAAGLVFARAGLMMFRGSDLDLVIAADYTFRFYDGTRDHDAFVVSLGLIR